MSHLRGAIACAAALAVGGCSVIVGTFLAKHEVVAYAEHDVEFSHRQDWTVTAETETTMGVELTMITIDGPESALVIVQRFRPGVAIDADQMLEDFTSDMRATPDRSVVVFTQIADEDAADMTEGFDTILDSLVVR